MIVLFGGLGTTLETRTPEWITSMHACMLKLDGEVKEASEVVASQGLQNMRGVERIPPSRLVIVTQEHSVSFKRKESNRRTSYV